MSMTRSEPASSVQATVIRNIGWLVAYDQATDRQVYRRGADIAFVGGQFVDPTTLAPGDIGDTIDGSDLMVVPGFIDLHAHPGFETMLKGVTEEVGSRQFWMSSLYEYLYLFDTTHEGMVASTKVALSELMQSGVTTIVDISTPHEGWVETLAASGMRAYAAPMFRDAYWFTDNGREVKYDFDEAKGKLRMDAALAAVDAAIADPGGRLSGMVVPAQIDTCSEGMFRASLAEARARNIPIQVHASQAVVEFQEIQHRTGMSPVGWLGSMDLLGPDMTIGHGIFLDHHSWLHWPERNDLALLAETGTSVAHCPTVFVRRGITMQHAGLYLERGVNLALGTDTYPHNFIEEMRNGIYAARITAADVAALDASRMLHMATLGGAKALGRTDIGRIAPGARADFFTVDLRHPSMRPVYDPIRSLIFTAGERPVRDVYVDGSRIVHDGVPAAFDLDAARDTLEQAQASATRDVARYDWAHRPAEVLMPRTLTGGEV
ncbi:N-ethylammeline chlorohydrolase [Sinirhodobacter populi]|uniref:N-ethylammeline chlorohydrolase n=2 Tax=Paenirhodobacter populi TaxID=2306993 RepID=A0A443K6H2_9RHOB|nr:N-ethylammeline chlorohydrolase [Sinirhodobacter populi]